MDKKLREQERRLESQLMLVSVYTILALLLVAITIFYKWELWVIPIIVMTIISVWMLHISQRFPEKIRIYYYLSISILLYFYYGTHPEGIFGMPIVLFILMLSFVLVDELAAIYIAVATYFMTLGYHFFITHSLTIGDAPEQFERLFFGVVSSIISGYILQFVLIRKRAEKEDYFRVIKELENTTRRAEDFLTNVSHELRTPINAVTGITDIMLKNEENPEKRRNLQSIQKAGHRLFSQISDILDYTELITDKIQISSESYMISSTISDLVAELKLLENPNDIEVIFDISTQVPSILKGDDAKIKKIILHLVDNSFKFTRSGGVYVKISSAKREYGVNLNITVTDTGIGIENDKLDKIFERFYQADGGRSRKAGGMGLGLSIVLGLVKMMNGFMYITRENGIGTTVKISIPQGVIDELPCISVTKNETTCIASYTNPRKYSSPEVREFYNIAIENLRAGLGVTLYKTTSLTELKKLQKAYSLTHIYIGREEYDEDPEYFEKLGETICVIVIANEKKLPKGNCNIIPIQKPFIAFPLMNILENGSKIYMRNTFFSEKRMICPGIRALVVDDDEMNLMVASGILHNYQMEVTLAISGIQAIKLCEENSFDIIFLDHMMPDMDGIETMHRLRSIVKYTDENVVIVALTANAVSGAREMFLQEGFDEFVAKPIETSSFERVLKKLLPSSAVQYVTKKPLAPKRRLETELQPDVSSGEEAESVKEEKLPASELVKSLADYGVDTVSGINYCRGDANFYLDLLKGFIAAAKSKKDEIASLSSNEDWDSYRIKVHALKSSSKTVGLNSLSESAESLENAAKKSDIPFIMQNTPALLSLIDETAAKIATLFAEKAEEKPPVEEAPVHKDSAGSLWLEKLGELKSSLETLEGEKAEAVIHEMESQIFNGKSGKEVLGEVLTHVQNFDYELAVDVINRMEKEYSGEK